MLDVRIFEFDEKGRLASQTGLRRGSSAPMDRGPWRRCSAVTLNSKATRTRPAWSIWRAPPCSGRPRSAPTWWRSLLKPDRMATLDLFQFIRHLNANGQSAQKYEIEFWRKVFYPLELSGDGGAGAALCVPALPLGRHRGYVFGGVMAGIQLLPAQQRFRLCGQPAKLVAMADSQRRPA